MMKRLSTILFTSFLVFLLMVVSVSSVQAQGVGPQEWKGVCLGGPDNDVATIQGFQCLVGNVLSVAVTIIGLAGFVMLIYGSFQYMLSGGSSKSAETARNTLTFAIAGLILALSSFIILGLLAAFTGIGAITKFTIFSPDTVFVTR